MAELSSASPEELRAEMARREAAAAIPVPEAKPLAEIDWSAVHSAATELVRFAVQDGYFDEDAPNYVYEAAMEAVFGKEFWTWRNARR